MEGGWVMRALYFIQVSDALLSQMLAVQEVFIEQLEYDRASIAEGRSVVGARRHHHHHHSVARDGGGGGKGRSVFNDGRQGGGAKAGRMGRSRMKD